ncbi:MAG: methylenetetrahydrofolate reductase [Bradyrhizobiaceae bacterium]|nr:methylenetetrahydrofolate reductase [Bradyrhizobiaceae bacterium]
MNAAVVAAQDDGQEAQRIAAFAARASFEATRLEAGDVEALRAAFPGRTPVYVSAVPKRPLSAQVETTARVAGAGFEPVPHISARSFASAADLDRHLRLLATGAGVRRVLVIGGDLPAPAGPFFSALEVIESGLLQARGIAEAGIAGYPEGHPRLDAPVLERAMAEKIEAATGTGLAIHIVTQFCFSAPAILAWIARLRDHGIDLPVRVGLAGPTTLSGLLRFARICGVSASAQGLVRHTGLARQLFGMVTPDTVLRPLAGAAAGRTSMAPHIFPFGGLATAARWAGAAAAGRFTLDRDDGFTVAPP